MALLNTVYVRVRKDHFQVRHLESGVEKLAVSPQPFTTTRCLIGQFGPAQALLKATLKPLVKGGFLALAPRLVIHPVEMAEGGLSEVEERVLREVALGAGAAKAVVWAGHQLSDDEVREKLRAG